MSDKKARSDMMDKFVLRMPDGLREEIRQAAEKSGRSMNAEMIYRLQNFKESDEITFKNLQRLIAVEVEKQVKESA